MARKKRKKKEPFKFKAPEFDEVGFMKREVEGAKAAMLTLAYAFAVALASWALFRVGLGGVGALVGFVALFGLRYLYPLAGLDMSRFDWKLWAGNGAIHIFAWFAFWVLLLNPPFVDVSAPVIHNVLVPGGTPFSIGPGGPAINLPLGAATSFRVLANVTDNQELADVTMRVAVGGSERQNGRMTKEPTGALWAFNVDAPITGTYTLTIEAVDRAGHRSPPFVFVVATT